MTKENQREYDSESQCDLDIMEPDGKYSEPANSPSLLWGRIPVVPLAFLGLGLYRAWIEITFVGSFADFPDGALSARNIFDLTMILVAVFCVLRARRIGPFYNKKIVYALSFILLTSSTALLFTTPFFPETAGFVGAIGAACGGAGIAFLILLWSELYGCLNPLKVASYYSLSIVVGALVVYVYRGFMFPWLFAMTALLPLASLLCVSKGFAMVPKAERPSTLWIKHSVPWKAVALMAIYALAYGLLESRSYEGTFGPHSSPGALMAGLIVFFGIATHGKHFDFGIIYRVALPFMATALLLLPVFNFLAPEASAFCVSAGYTLQSILIMIIVANLCYRYGASAIWLFGIERSVRQLFMLTGREISSAAQNVTVLGISGETFVSALAALAIISASMILLSERELSSSWGISMIPESSNGTNGNPVNANHLSNHSAGKDALPESTEIQSKHELGTRVANMAREYKLSTREEEVLLLLAQRKTVGMIERELFIANGTAKAHVRHIYQKLDIHTRQELFDMLHIECEAKGNSKN